MILALIILSFACTVCGCIWFFFLTTGCEQNRAEFLSFSWRERFVQTGSLCAFFFVVAFALLSLTTCSGGGGGCTRDWDGRSNPISC